MQQDTLRRNTLQRDSAQQVSLQQDTLQRDSSLQKDLSQKDTTMQRSSSQGAAPNVSTILLSQMALWGIKNIYGVAGDAIIPLLDAIQKQDALHYYAVRHETAGAFMASSEGKCTGNLGVCVGTSGPGLANMLNGIADAAADHVPMLVITGQVKSDKVGTEAKQYIDQEQLIAPLAVFSASLLHPDAAVTLINKVIIEAKTKRGVAHISVPKDVLSLPCSQDVRPPLGMFDQIKTQNYNSLDQAVAIFNQAQRPVIYLGKGARSASSDIMRLAEKTNAAIIESLGAKGIVPASHTFYLGGIGIGGTLESSELLKQSDCILMIGVNWYPSGFVPNQTQIIKIDISPGSIEAQQDVSVGIVGDAAEILPILVGKIQSNKREEWFNTISSTKADIIQKLDIERKSIGSTITPQVLIAGMEQFIADDGIISLDTGDHTLWFNRIFRAKQQQVTFSGKWRTMGYGLPAAISAKLAYPNKEVTALVGDGSILMTFMELATLVKYNVHIKIIVANNGALGAEKSKMTAAGIHPFGVDLTNPDFAKLATAFGIKGVRVDKAENLSAALKDLFLDDQSVLLDVVITDDPPPLTGLSG